MSLPCPVMSELSYGPLFTHEGWRDVNRCTLNGNMLTCISFISIACLDATVLPWILINVLSINNGSRHSRILYTVHPLKVAISVVSLSS